MADETRNILFKLQLDVDALTKSGKDAEGQIAKLREQQQGLNKDSLQYKTIQADIKTYTAQLKASADAIAINNRLQSTGVQGIIQTRDALKAATIELYNAEKAWGAQSEQAIKARGVVQGLTGSLDVQTATIGKHYMQVGNYTGQVMTLSKGLGGVVGLLDIMGKTMGLDTETIKSLSEAHHVLIAGARDLHHITELQTEAEGEKKVAMEGEIAVTEGATAAQEGLNVAMEANPIGIILAAIAGVIALGAAIATYVAYGKEAEEYEKDMQTAMDGTRFKTRELADEWDKNILKLKEVEREYQTWGNSISDNQAKISDIKDENAAALNKLSKDTETKLHEINGFWNNFKDGVMKYLDVISFGTVSVLEKLGIKMKTTQDKMNEELAKSKQEAINIGAEYAVKRVKQQEEEDKKVVAEMEETSKRLEEAEKKRIELAKKISEQKIADEKKAWEEYYKVLEQHVKDEIDLDLKKAKDKLDTQIKTEKNLVDDLTRNDLEITKYIQKSDANKFVAEQKRILQEREQLLKKVAEDKAINDKINGQSLASDKLFESQRLAIITQTSEQIKAVKLAEAEMTLGSAATIFNSLGGLYKKDTVDQKAFALAAVAFDEAKAIAAAIAAASANPMNATTFGAAGVAQLAATLPPIIAGIVQAKQILSTPTVAEKGTMIPFAEKGTILGGRSHAEGGTTISADGIPIAIAEKGELLTIVNKKSTAILQRLSNLNSMNGNGIPFFANGGIIPHFQTGGNLPLSNLSQPIAEKYAEQNMMLKYMKLIPAPVVAVQDIISETNKQVSIVNGASI